MNFTQKNAENLPAIDKEVLLRRMTNRIRQSLELQEILTVTVAEIRDFLGTDRVMVYRFHNDDSGEVIAESIAPDRLPSLQGLNFPADDIPPQIREQFVKVRQRAIVDVATQQIGLSALDCPETGQLLGTEDISYRSVDPCHVQYLRAMGVQSSLAVPILQYDIVSQQSKPKLWGLLVSHNAEPRTIFPPELEVVQRVADQVSIAIGQSTLLSLARQKAEQEATINRVATLLHAHPTIELQAALAETVALFDGVGGRIYIAAPDSHPQIYTCGDLPDLNENERLSTHHPSSLEEHLFWRSATYKPNHLRAISDIHTDPSARMLGTAFQGTKIRSLLSVPLEYRQQLLGYLTIFRNEVDIETLWAGHFDTDQRQIYPRRSFEAWRQLKQGQARDWSSEEIQLAQALGHHFAMAVQQYQLYQQISHLNADLERQVEKRTNQLQRSLNLAKVLKQVTDEIRSSLDSKTILQTIVGKVQKLLDVDRVIIYQLIEEWHGEVVVEAVKGDWLSLLGFRGGEDCFPPEITYLYKQGKIWNAEDVLTANITPPHRKFLLDLQVRANLVVPISRGEQLWGLLVAHECHGTRAWQNDEIDLLQQLAAQAAIAIYQAELYQQTCAAAIQEQARAKQLENALDELQKTQSQLIQTEKMSSLGQLVAGVAHEINNPVNFIYGNLIHASQYTHDILELLQVYQEIYSDPHPVIAEKIEEIELEFLTEDLPKLLNSMKVGADRIRQLVLSLRNFSRLDQSERKLVDIHEGIESTLMILQHRLKPKTSHTAIQIVKKYGNLPPVECYAGQLNQVFMNLLSNAVDALEQRDSQRTLLEQQNQPSQITIQTQVLSDSSLDRQWIGIRIADNGIGMPPEVQSRIFDPFFTTKEPGKGTGLGLAIGYQILVEKHGGKFNCTSAPGQGTEFFLEIPVHPLGR